MTIGWKWKTTKKKQFDQIGKVTPCMSGPYMAVGQNQRYHFGVGACRRTHFRTYFSGDWDVHWGITGLLTHGHMEDTKKQYFQ